MFMSKHLQFFFILPRQNTVLPEAETKSQDSWLQFLGSDSLDLRIQRDGTLISVAVHRRFHDTDEQNIALNVFIYHVSLSVSYYDLHDPPMG